MPAQDIEKLVVQLSADINKFEKSLSRAQGVTQKRMSAIEKKAVSSSKALSATFAEAGATINGALGKIGLGGIAAGGIAGLVAGFREVASSVADIGSEAQRAGLSTKAFQELKFAAEQSRISVDALTDGMKELSLRTDEFIVSSGRSGSAAESFKRLGFTVDELKTKIKDPSALLSEIIGKVQKLDKAAQIRIFDELFGGTGGEVFTRFIEQGEAGLRANIKAADDLGIVIDEAVIQRAAEVDRQFKLIAATIGGNLKAAIVDAFSALAAFIDSYRDVQNQANSTIDNRVAELGKQRLDVETKILEAKQQQREFDGAGLLNPLSQANNNVDLQNYQTQLQQIADEEKKLVEERNKRVLLQPAKLPPPSTTTYSAGAPVSSGGGGSKSKGTDPYTAAAQSIREHIAALQAETAAQAALNPLVDDYGYAVEYAKTKQDLLTAAQKAGKDITPELAASIDQLAAGYANASVEAQKLAKGQDAARAAAEQFRSTSKDVVSGFISDLRSGTSAAEALANALNKVVDKLIDVALSGIDGKGGIIGGVFSLLGIGKKDGGIVKAATGGYVSGPGTGRSDSIPARLSDGEFVVNAAATQKNLPLLKAINSGKRFANGGSVGTVPSLPSRSSGGGANQPATVVNIQTQPGLQTEQTRTRRGNTDFIDIAVKQVGATYGLKRPVTQV